MSKLTDAVKADRRTALAALRDNLAEALDDTDRPPHTSAPLARQLAAVLRELDELPDPSKPLSKREQIQRRVDAAR